MRGTLLRFHEFRIFFVEEISSLVYIISSIIILEIIVLDRCKMIDLTEYNLNNVSNYGTVNLLKKKPIKIQL